MSTSARDIERAADQMVRQLDDANDSIRSLIETIGTVEQIASAADGLDLRSEFGAKRELNDLRRQVQDLVQNLKLLERQLSDTDRIIYKALT